MPSIGLCGVILAAGESSRMGRDKALLPWPPLAPSSPGAPPGSTILTSTIQALSAYCDLVIVVVGKNREALESLVYANAAFLAVNPAPERGQFSSLQIGLQEVLKQGRDAALITLVDHPPPRHETLARLTDAFGNRPHQTWALIPEHQGTHGHPILIGREMIEAFLRAPATSNAREVEHAHQPNLSYFSIDDPRVTTNVDTPQDYASLESR
jgi:molybdenum cofactor cytidylyltransferase